MKDVLLALSICLGACTSIVPSTLVHLRGLDPLSVDPADIAVQVDLPDGLGLVRGSGTLDLQAVRGDVVAASGRFPIERVDNVLRVAPTAHAGLRTLQADIRDLKAADPDGISGSLSVDFEPCRQGLVVSDTGRMSVYIRLEAGGPFLPLIRDAPVDDALDRVTQGPLKSCP